MTDELQELETLVRSDGWTRLVEFANRDLAIKLTDATEQAADNPDDTLALGKLRQVIASKRAVRLLLDWPVTRIAQLKAKLVTTTTDYSRRGDL